MCYSFSSKEQAFSNFMATVTVCRDFGARENKSLLPLFCHLFAMKGWDGMPWSYFFECWVLSQFFHSLISYIHWPQKYFKLYFKNYCVLSLKSNSLVSLNCYIFTYKYNHNQFPSSCTVLLLRLFPLHFGSHSFRRIVP